MRKVSRAHTLVPAELTSADCQQHLQDIIATPSTAVNPDYYKGKLVYADGTVTYTVREALKTLYHHKCAYCECTTHAPKMDHHRPKGRIVGMPRHSNGYYWLVYEWSNLLPSCTNCNAIDAKGSRYPVLGNRNRVHPQSGNPAATDSVQFVYDHAFNTAENAQLLHPEYSDPATHFGFDRFGKIFAKTAEGQSTIETMKLDRDDLNGLRKTIYLSHLNPLKRHLNDFLSIGNPEIKQYINGQIYDWLVELVTNSKDEILEYTLFRKTLVNEFEYFFIEPLDPVLQPIITDIFLDNIAHII